MGLLDFLLKREPKTLQERINALQEKKRLIDSKLAEAQLRLAREREQPNPDALKIDRFEHDIAIWAQQKKKVDDAIAKFQ
jgi:hypothetical protein